MSNQEIRTVAKEKRVFLYEVAEKLGISEPTMTRLLRRELPQEKKGEIIGIIAEIATARAAAN